MDTKHEILLEQILDELRAQTKALQDLQIRMAEIEKALSGRDGDVKVVMKGKEGLS